MTTTESPQSPRMLTPDELAFCIRAFREAKRWSQEQLAEIARLSVRTIQRVERGKSVDFDTRRALASAFDFEDIDTLNKPFHLPTAEEPKASKEQFDRQNVTLSAVPLSTGRLLANLAERCSMDITEPAFELAAEAAAEFAALVDYFREYRDCADLYSETQKLEVYDDLQMRIDALKGQGVSLLYAERKVQVKWSGNESPPMVALYVVAFPLGDEPQQLTVSRNTRIHF